MIDVESHRAKRAIDLAGDLPPPPRADGSPVHERLDERPFLAGPTTGPGRGEETRTYEACGAWDPWAGADDASVAADRL
uniref:Uncharacterized protein n=1 Tax=Streptomyces sp. NBC_00049 TaxID=2903617 RepID=A0AAU2JY22_9ACTN